MFIIEVLTSPSCLERCKTGWGKFLYFGHPKHCCDRISFLNCVKEGVHCDVPAAKKKWCVWVNGKEDFTLIFLKHDPYIKVKYCADYHPKMQTDRNGFHHISYIPHQRLQVTQSRIIHGPWNYKPFQCLANRFTCLWLTIHYKIKIYYLVITIMRYVFLNLEETDNVWTHPSPLTTK